MNVIAIYGLSIYSVIGPRRIALQTSNSVQAIQLMFVLLRQETSYLLNFLDEWIYLTLRRHYIIGKQENMVDETGRLVHFSQCHILFET